MSSLTKIRKYLNGANTQQALFARIQYVMHHVRPSWSELSDAERAAIGREFSRRRSIIESYDERQKEAKWRKKYCDYLEKGVK